MSVPIAGKLRAQLVDRYQSRVLVGNAEPDMNWWIKWCLMVDGCEVTDDLRVRVREARDDPWRFLSPSEVRDVERFLL